MRKYGKPNLNQMLLKTVLKSTRNSWIVNCSTGPNQSKLQIMFYKKRQPQNFIKKTLLTLMFFHHWFFFSFSFFRDAVHAENLMQDALKNSRINKVPWICRLKFLFSWKVTFVHNCLVHEIFINNSALFDLFALQRHKNNCWLPYCIVIV